jgi:drug/metabolite transporter (DMT)-like permease
VTVATAFSGSLMNSILLMVSPQVAIEYTPQIASIAIVMAASSGLGIAASSIMFYHNKLSFSLLIMNLMLVIVSLFDVFVMEREFTLYEIFGCALMIIANLRLLFD